MAFSGRNLMAYHIVRNLKRGRLSVEEIAEDNDVSVKLVLKIQAEMNKASK